MSSQPPNKSKTCSEAADLPHHQLRLAASQSTLSGLLDKWKSSPNRMAELAKSKK